MTKQTEATRPDGSEFSAELGPIPAPDLLMPWRVNAPDFSAHSSGYTYDQMRSERQRCYALGAAEERERLRALVDTERDEAASLGCPEAAHWLAHLASKLAELGA